MQFLRIFIASGWQQTFILYPFLAERQWRSVGLPGTRAQSHRRRQHPEDKVRLIAARAFCQRRFLLRVDIQSVQTLPQLGEELTVWRENQPPCTTLPQHCERRRGGGFGANKFQDLSSTARRGEISLWKAAIMGFCG